MSSSFTFGSFGDITTLVQLAWSVRRALSDVSGASAQIRALTQDVGSFTRVLDQIKLALRRPESIPEEFHDDIEYALKTCFEILADVKRRLDQHTVKTSNARGKSKAKLDKLRLASAWEIFGGKREVESMKSRLLEQITVIQTLIATAQAQHADRLAEEVQKHQQHLADMAQQQMATFSQLLLKMFRTMNQLTKLPSTSTSPFIFFTSEGAQRLPLCHMPLVHFQSTTPFNKCAYFDTFDVASNKYGTLMLEWFPPIYTVSGDVKRDTLAHCSITAVLSQTQHVLSDYDHLPWQSGSKFRCVIACFLVHPQNQEDPDKHRYSSPDIWDSDNPRDTCSVYLSEVFIYLDGRVLDKGGWVVAPGLSSCMSRIFRTGNGYFNLTCEWTKALGLPLDSCVFRATTAEIWEYPYERFDTNSIPKEEMHMKIQHAQAKYNRSCLTI